MSTTAAGLLAGATGFAAGCNGAPGAALQHGSVEQRATENAEKEKTDGAVEFAGENFMELYPTFMVRHSMPLGEKAALWNKRYLNHYVRWTGTIRSFTPSGITVKERPATVTFDVSLWMEADQLTVAHRRFKIGDTITYLGRLENYDDIFRTMYLGHGMVADGAGAAGGPDGGTVVEAPR